MTYGEVKRMALRLIFSDTAAGQPIAESYNDQADYLAAIPALVDSAQTDIAVRARRIPALCPVDSLSEREEGGFRVLTLPADCREPMQRRTTAAGGRGTRALPGLQARRGQTVAPEERSRGTYP